MSICLSLLSTLALAIPLAPPQEGETVPLTIEDFGKWRRLTGSVLSERGDWAAFGYQRREKDDVLHVRQLDGDKKYEVPRGSSPAFSDDSSWVAYYLDSPVKEAEKLRKDKKPVPRQVELLDLGSGARHSWDNAASFAFSKGSALLAIHKRKASKDAKHDGTNLILRRLSDGGEELLGSVKEFRFNKPGTKLAYTVSAADQDGNGVHLLDLRSGSRQPLDNHKADYTRLTFSENGEAVALLRGEEAKGYSERENTLLAFTGLEQAKPARAELKAKEAFGFPKDMVISEKGALSWAEPPARVFFGLKKQSKKPEKEKEKDGDDAGKDEEIANVDIWHWKDERIQSVQMVRASRDRDRTDQAVFHITGTRPFVRLVDDSMRTIQLSRDGRWGIGQDDRAYRSDWREGRADIYRVDTLTGERTLVLKAHLRTLGLSPTSRHFLYWLDDHVWLLDLESGETRNLTQDAPISFRNEEFDRVGEKPPYGVAGWTEDGAAVVLNHRYDLWLQPLDGSAATNLTGIGAEQEIRLRHLRTDPDERFLDPRKPWLLTAYGQWTKKSGFFTLTGGELKQHLYLDRRVTYTTKARQADRYLFTLQSFDESPDLHVSDGTFENPRRISDTNPQQVGFLWGRRILFEYENRDKVRLQGTLAIPETYAEGQKLPMLVNFYEKNSQNLHRYPAPVYRSSPQFARYVSNGYLVMQPDVHFRTGRSHSDMLECVEAAVAKVIEMGYADPERVGLHGHSYSGQGAAFIATRSKMFDAVVAGAAATNLVSDFNQLWKSAGTSQHRYDIHGQGRFGTDPYTDLQLYLDESAISHVQSMNIPLLLLHGTEDGSVEWLQAVEFYNALRFNGKNVILLSYPGEGHGLRRFENQKDFLTRMWEFFEHHLRGKPAPDWMTRGVTFLEKERRRKQAGGGEGK